MIESVREHVVHMLHTHDGARVAMMCLWHGTAKVGICRIIIYILINYIVILLTYLRSVMTSIRRFIYL